MCVYTSHKKEAVDIKSLRQERILGVEALREAWYGSKKEKVIERC